MFSMCHRRPSHPFIFHGGVRSTNPWSYRRVNPVDVRVYVAVCST